MSLFKMGCDPEVFIGDRRTGNVIPICGLIGGTKEKPLQIEDDPNYALQEDNVMLEFNTPPATGIRSFVRTINIGLGHAKRKVTQANANYEVIPGCAYMFTDDVLSAHPASYEFGCSPDFDAYQPGNANSTITKYSLYAPPNGSWRFAGGHLHLGGNLIPPEHICAMFCDVCLGLPSVAADKQGKRRPLYGSPGRYRKTPYGIEYRTLSNFWIFDRFYTELIAKKLYYLGEFLTNEDNEKTIIKALKEIPWYDVRCAISEENEQLAAALLRFISQDISGVPVV